MGRKVSRGEHFQSSFPAIKPGDLDGELVAVTVQSAEAVDFGADSAIVLTYTEVPEKRHRLNATSFDRLVEGTGSDDLDDWEGRRIALEVVRTTHVKTGETVTVVWVADPEEWPRQVKSRKQAKARRGRKGA